MMVAHQIQSKRAFAMLAAMFGVVALVGVPLTVAVAHDFVYLLGQYLQSEARAALVLCGAAAVLLLRRIAPRAAAGQTA